MKRVTIIFILAVLVITTATLSAQSPPSVQLSYNRFYNYDEVVGLLQTLEKKYSDFLDLQSMGKSTQGREMWVMILNNPKTGPQEHKAAMYIDANIHGNEVQGAEAVIYTIDYLMTNYGILEKVTRLVDERAFYFVPMANPDGRAQFFDRSGMSGYARGGMEPTDDDRDGLFDEDGNDDLDGDGLILQMRKKVTDGPYRVSSYDSRLLERVKPGETGDYVLLGTEGLDNDKDGRLNEDSPGGYDMNRNWATDWQPTYVQYGAGDYPFSYPEPRAIANFILKHPNIAGVQAYHNSGGMILRGPGDKSQGTYSRNDIAVYDYIGQQGEAMLPFYRYMILWKDLYPVHGGFINWTAEGLGIFSFSNELWSSSQYDNKPREESRRSRDSEAYMKSQQKRLQFDDNIEMGARYIEWKPFNHPDYGPVELGGWVHDTGRVPPLFMLEELCHRNAMFTLFHAEHMPLVKIAKLEKEQISSNTYKLWVTIRNTRAIPTIGELAAEKHLIAPDILTIEGKGLKVVSAGQVTDPWNKLVQNFKGQPKRIVLEQGIPGNGKITVQWIVEGRGKAVIKWQSQKGGTQIGNLELN